MIGNTHAIGKRSNKTKLKISISKMGNTNAIKYDPNDPYCDIWKDGEYRKDLRKDYCENINCKDNYKQLANHHIDLDKKNCHPNNIMTLCHSCHMILHRKLQNGNHIVMNPKDFLVINRLDHVSYINKKTRSIVRLHRR